MKKSLKMCDLINKLIVTISILFFLLFGTQMMAQTDVDNQQAEKARVSAPTVVDTLLADEYLVEADLLLNVSELDSAFFYLDKAIAIYQKYNMWQDCVVAYNTIGKSLYKKEEYKKAIKFLELAMQTAFDKLPPKDLVLANTYNYIGIVYRRKGNYDKALEYHLQALEVQRSKYDENHPALLTTYYNIGNACYYSGDYEQAQYYNQKVVNMQSLSFRENHPQLAPTYKNIGLTNAKLKNYNRALEVYQKALEIQRKELFPEHAKVASIYTSMAEVYEEMGNYEAAIATSNDALTILEKTFEATHPDFAANYNIIGNAHLDQQQFAEALAYYQQGFDSRIQILTPNHPLIAESYLKIGEVYNQQKDYNNALSYYQKALIALVEDFTDIAITANPTLQKISSETYLLEALRAKADCLTQQYSITNNKQELNLALYTYDLAAQLITIIGTRYRPDVFRLFTLEEGRKIYEGGIHAAYQLYEQAETITQKDKFLDMAFQLCQKSNKALLIDALKSPSLKKFAQVPTKIIDEIQETKIDLAYYKHKLLTEQQKIVPNANNAQNSELDRFAHEVATNIKEFKGVIVSLTDNYQSLLDSLQQSYPKYYELYYDSQIITQQEMNQVLVQQLPNTALLQYCMMMDSTAYLLLIHPKGNHFLPIDKKIQQHILPFRKVLTNYKLIVDKPNQAYKQYTEHAHQLYELLLKKATNSLQAQSVEQLIIVPNGTLSYLPFESLLTQSPPKNVDYQKLNYLFNQYKISYTYVVSDLWEQLQQARLKRTASYWGMGTVYDRERLAISSDLSIARIAREINAELTGARKEVEMLREEVNAKIFSGKQATESNFKIEFPETNVAHMSLHLLLDDANPLDSKVLFARGKTPKEDDLLHVHELYNIEVNNDLAIWSAAHHSTKELKQGEGILHLNKGLTYAGCPSMIYSLWRTEDNACVDVMRYLYQELQNGQDLPTALQTAQKHFLQQPNQFKGHPYFWAGFVLAGDPRPIHRTFPLFYLLLGSLMFFGIIGAYFWQHGKE